MIPQRSNRRRPDSELAPARKEVSRLFDEAERYFLAGDKEMAKRRVRAARKAAMKVRLRVPEHNHRFCRKCESYLKQGVNCTVRIRAGIRITRCLECGAVRRKVLKGKK